MTLDRVLSRFGLASRTEARETILAGQVKVNGRVVRDPDRWTDPRAESFIWMGSASGRHAKSICCFTNPRESLPVTAIRTGEKPFTIVLTANVPWVSPVGRLDKDTSGLLLLTNDTDFANHVTDPASQVPKHTW